MQRYDLFCSYDGGGPPEEEEAEDGAYVRYEDAASEIERLRESYARARNEYDHAQLVIERLREENEKYREGMQENCGLRKEIERLRRIINDTCAVLKAPDLDNDGGVVDLAEDVRLLLHNHTTEALEAQRLREENCALRVEVERLRAVEALLKYRDCGPPMENDNG